MTRYNNHEDEADDDDLDDEVEDWDQDDENTTYSCPHCGEDVYEEAQWCPHCEQYLSEEDAPSQGKPWWIVAGVIVVLGLVYVWTVGLR